MGQPVVHFEVIGKDPEKLREFYSQMFDWNFSDPIGPTNYRMVDRNTNDDGVGIAGGIGGVPEGYDGHVTFYVEVDDVGTALDKAEELGGKKMMGPDQVPEGPVIGLFVDPQGHTVGLVGGGEAPSREESGGSESRDESGGSESRDESGGE
jgi:predicted enzyme related to lactoylglutathione lyase